MDGERMTEKTCQNCAINKEIVETLNASEGAVDLTGELCGNCVNQSNWTPIKEVDENGKD